MTSKKMAQGSEGLKGFAVPLLVSAIAFVVYLFTFADYIFPGESAQLFAQWAGHDALTFPSYPVWGWLVAKLAAGSFPASMALRVNLLSLLSGVFSAGVLSYLVGWFVRQSVTQEDAALRRAGAMRAAEFMAGFVFIFSGAMWQGATHLDFRMFDVALALAGFLVFPAMVRWAGAQPFFAAFLGFYTAVGLFESPIFAPIGLLYLFALIVVTIKTGRSYYVNVPLFLAVGLGGFFLVAQPAVSSWLTSPEAKTGDYTTFGAVLTEAGLHYAHEIRSWFTRPGWLYVFLFCTLPFVACTFAAGRGLDNDRRWSQYLFHAAMSICTILAVATPLSPESLLRPFGIAPVAISTLAAATAGYLAAYWFLLARVALPQIDYGDIPSEVRFGKKAAPAFGLGFFAVMVLSALVASFSFSSSRGAFADRCAGEILDRLGDRTWFVTDGTLDAHLRVQAALRGRELNLVCLQRDLSDSYLRELSAVVKARQLKAGAVDLSMSAQLGVLPFLQDWFAGDPDVASKAGVFGVPDFWYMAKLVPVPEGLFFAGIPDAKKFDAARAKADFDAFWAKMKDVLTVPAGWGSRQIAKADDPVDVLRMQLRRHMGFLANNLGVALQDAGHDDAAFAVYDLVLKKIDPDNVCTLFNEFEMARRGVKVAVPHRNEIEKQLKAIVDDPKRRYLLWSLSRYYGYIRSPEIFARMGFAWARSGQTGSAIAQVKRAIEFVPADRQAGLLNMMAAIYASGNDARKSRETYERVLAQDAGNHDALMGLARLALQEGEVEAAKKYLTDAVKHADSKDATGYEWALIHLMNNDLVAARLAMQKVTDLQPKSLQAWSLLAGVLLQQYDTEKDAKLKAKAMEELESVILPRMEKLADSPRDYFVQMTRGLVLMRKGKDAQKAARDAFVTASSARPDVTAANSLVLDLDIRLDDADSAEKHARRALRVNRNDKLANYVMGSIRLKEGDYANAEKFLILSVSQPKPIAAAQNDLAEVLRRQQRYADAEKYARDAVKNAPDLYVAWETLGSCLLDQGKDAAEAEKCVQKAISLAKEKNNIEDIRMQITLARAQVARGDLGRARGTVRTLRAHQKELTDYDRGEVEKLASAILKR